MENLVDPMQNPRAEGDPDAPPSGKAVKIAPERIRSRPEPRQYLPMNASLIGRYLFRNLTLTTLVVTATLSLVMWLIQSLRLFELAINGGAPFGLFVTLLLLTLPGVLVIVLPIALFFTIAFVYNKLTADSELIVLRALGMSQWRLAAPALTLGVLIALAVFVLNAFIYPAANQRLKTLQDMIRGQYAGALLNDGVFNPIGDKLTVYVHDRAANGDLRGILVYQDQDNGKPVTIVAKRGVLVEGEHGPEIIVYDGKRQEVDPRTGHAPFTEFQRYAIDLEQVQETLTQRWKEPSERSLPELLSGPQGAADKGFDDVFRAEANNRMASPFFSLALTAIGLVALLGGHFDRRGQWRRILAGSLAMVTIEGLSIGLSNLARLHDFAVPLLYLAALLPALAALSMLARANDGWPPWRSWLAGKLPWWPA
jgi:lipopolysaccharide export system permease protein